MIISDFDRSCNSALLVVLIAASYLALPPDVSAIEVGCFCTFMFVSLMFIIGIGFTLFGKYKLGLKIWKLSLKRTVVITLLEVILLVAVLFILQTKFYLRVLAYLPLAFFLNFVMTVPGSHHDEETGTSKNRAVMAALSCAILPIAVQFMAWVSTVLSALITFKEVRV